MKILSDFYYTGQLTPFLKEKNDEYSKSTYGFTYPINPCLSNTIFDSV
ncbi:hypothetical protein BTTAP_10384 [Brochothrix thermosphacta]|nr:hypothetical protein BTTAP_10384 [Brochothrix thermosphacta]